MSAQQIITEHLDLWTSAHKTRSSAGRGSSNKLDLVGIKKLRELILELAVRGKLVPQDANDEPASELLKKIAAEKAKLIKEGKIKKEKTLSEITDEEKPFELPSGWEWMRFNDLTNSQFPISYGVLVPGLEESGGVPFIRIADLDIKNPPEKPEKSISSEIDAQYERTRIYGGEILMGVVGSIGKLGVAPASWKGANIARAICRIKIWEFLNKDYGLMLLQSDFMQKNFLGDTRTLAQPTLNIGFIRVSLTPVPPLAEQHRIVAKVDELMAFCDQLEQTQSGNIAAHAQLVEALLATLTNSSDHDELQNNWQRIAAHFDTLFTTEYSIGQLKQTILQLAVMGKLVPQNPNDEPASELLKKIAAEKAKLIKEGKIKKEKPLPEITDEEKPFELPRGWEFARMGLFSILKGGFAYQSSKFSDAGEHQVIRMGNIRPDYLRINEKAVFITDEYASTTTDYKLEVDDVLLTMTGTKNKKDYLYSVAINAEHLNDRQLYINQRLCAVKAPRINIQFLSLCLKNDTLLDAIFAKSTGTANQANIGMEAIACWVIPLAPLGEQHRIVAKVDELMDLCDALKTNLQNAQTTQLALADALVEQAVN